MVPADDGSLDSFSEAERLFAAWRVSRERASGEASRGKAIDDLCREHPQHAVELRELARSELLDEERIAAAFASGDDARTRAQEALAELGALGTPSRRYRLIKPIGEGATGTVFEAEDTLLGRRVAYKTIRDPSRADELLPMLLREMRLTARISHPGVAGIHDAGIDPHGRAYFTMPVVRGGSLLGLLQRPGSRTGDAALVRSVECIARVAETVAFAHRCGLVHRDLKPSNIRVGEFGEVYVMDWGAARVVADKASVPESDRVHAPGASMPGRGTPEYMSPEQWRASDAPHPADDVYAIGVMLYQFLAGRLPYLRAGESSLSVEELSRRVAAGPPEPIHALSRNAPVELASIAAKAMARDRAGRYPDASALSADLRAFLENRVVEAHQTGTWAEARMWVRRNRGLARGLGAAALSVLAALFATSILLSRSEINARRLSEQNRMMMDTQRRLIEKELELRAIGGTTDPNRAVREARTLIFDLSAEILGQPARETWSQEWLEHVAYVFEMRALVLSDPSASAADRTRSLDSYREAIELREAACLRWPGREGEVALANTRLAHAIACLSMADSEGRLDAGLVEEAASALAAAQSRLEALEADSTDEELAIEDLLFNIREAMRRARALQ